jgi:hypothetical protein
MNKNLFIYSFKYLAVLLALVTFSSCERDEFTEQDAFDLNEAQINAQDARDQAALAAQDKRVMDMAMFRRSMDSLTRLNSGGKVFYTVNVVPGGSSAFSSGRFEEVEGLDGATVTVSQLGGAIVEQKTTVAGLASFEMYSGEVTVNVEAPNHTDLNYTANLTPDGGVPNGSLIYVGNVVPVFDDPNNPAPGSEENLATVKGFAFAELDITFGNNQEEAVPDGTKVRAFINVSSPLFLNTYIREANAEEGTNVGGLTTRSGAIQQFAYEQAASTTGTTVTSALNNDTAPDGGEYSISIGATASGLPITMQFDDFAADRTYFFGGVAGDDRDRGVGAKRFIYTQNTQGNLNQATGGANGVGNAAPSAIGFRGVFDVYSEDLRLDFDLVKTEATATATLTGGDVVNNVNVTDGGFYYVAPTVAFSAPTTGTTATGTVVMGDITAADVLANPAAAGPRARGMKKVTGVTIAAGAGGSGYTAAPTVTFTRFSYTGRATNGVPVNNGIGTVEAASSTIKYIRIIDGGFGMTGNPAAGTAVTGVGTYTGRAPLVEFNDNVAPTGGVLATANLIVDTRVGTATEVQIVAEGNGYNNNVNITFNYGKNADVRTPAAGVPTPVTPNLFEAVGGQLYWNIDNVTPSTIATVSRTLTAANAGGEVIFAGGANYSFVPSVVALGLTTPAGATPVTFAATVINGVVSQIEMQGGTTGWPAGEHAGTISISVRNALISAEGFTEGGSIDSYEFTGNYGTPVGVYKSSVEAVTGGVFNYITADAAGVLRDETGTALAIPVTVPASTIPTIATLNAASDFVFVFENPTTGTSNAWGFPIFDNGGNNVVGLFFAPGTGQGIGYTGAFRNLTAATAAPNNAGYQFWILPNEIASSANAHLAKYAQMDTNPLADANASATAVNTAKRLTLTIVTPGNGYAIRPEFVISGGQRSAEDLAAVNSSLNTIAGGLRGNLNFNSAGAITTTTVSTAINATTFTNAGVAADPIVVKVSTARLEAIFNREVNWATGTADGIEITTNGDTRINAPAAWNYLNGFGGASTPLSVFNNIEGARFTADERVGSGNVAPPVAQGFKYISAPSYTINFFGFDTGGNGVAVLDPNTADITALSATNNGTFPTGLTVSSFSIPTNDLSYPAAGERFRTIGGPSNFSVFSGLTYIRDVNYGTGIELE